jgi:putrescine transport system ATP-binding protein
VVDNVPVWVALRPEKIMLCEEPPADGYNFAVGEVIILPISAICLSTMCA